MYIWADDSINLKINLLNLNLNLFLQVETFQQLLLGVQYYKRNNLYQ